ncbi:hypothetical protein ACFWIN_06015 [Streptomyces sp. NPDC127049]|uniref:hypothetical protein n=1 Tax=Streptomyces sp. NPDC127049 TaxID=3347118 RepID=UPI00364C2338
MIDSVDLRLQHMVEQTADKVTDPAGRLNKRELVAAVRRELGNDDLDPDTRSLALDRLAEKLVTEFGDRHNPRPRAGDSLFYPDDILKLGNGVWVRMARAKDFDLVAWQRLSRKNRTRVDEADNKIYNYTEARLEAFRATTDDLDLIDVERYSFGWSEDDATETGLF